jgi:hypothetical protein
MQAALADEGGTHLQCRANQDLHQGVSAYEDADPGWANDCALRIVFRTPLNQEIRESQAIGFHISHLKTYRGFRVPEPHGGFEEMSVTPLSNAPCRTSQIQSLTAFADRPPSIFP